jgi:electron transfer flavoprotein alpha/beta subunit
MFRINWRIGAVLLTAVAGGCLWLSTASEAQNPRQTESSSTSVSLPRPAMPTYELMDLMNEPLYQELHDLMQQGPSEHRWTAVEQDGLRLAEIANLVAIRKAAAENPTKWGQFSEDMWQAGNNLSQAARQHDVQEMNSAYSALIQSCNNCHHQLAPGYAPVIQP